MVKTEAHFDLFLWVQVKVGLIGYKVTTCVEM